MATNPIRNFKFSKVDPKLEIGNVDLSFTNASLFMLISAYNLFIFIFWF